MATDLQDGTDGAHMSKPTDNMDKLMYYHKKELIRWKRTIFNWGLPHKKRHGAVIVWQAQLREGF